MASYSEVIMNQVNARKKRVAVYCGSASGSDSAYVAEATALGRAIAEAGMGMVYGGANIGLMGAVADSALLAGAEVIGILPEILAGKEIAHTGLTSFEIVSTMHLRKARMTELADAFLILPGGFGTLDELMEAVTWAQLGIHSKPCILINCAGFWNGLLRFIESTITAGFVKPENRNLLLVVSTASEAVELALGG